jgi:hypothetical protein
MRISVATLTTAAGAAALIVLTPATASAKMHAREAILLKEGGQCVHRLEDDPYRLRKRRRDRSVWEITNNGRVNAAGTVVDECGSPQAAILCVYSEGGTLLTDRFEPCTGGADLNTPFSVAPDETVGLMCRVRRRTGPREIVSVAFDSGAPGSIQGCPATLSRRFHVIDIEIVP